MHLAEALAPEGPVRIEPALPITSYCRFIGDDDRDLTPGLHCAGLRACAEPDACESGTEPHSGAHLGMPDRTTKIPPDSSPTSRRVLILGDTKFRPVEYKWRVLARVGTGRTALTVTRTDSHPCFYENGKALGWPWTAGDRRTLPINPPIASTCG